MKGLGAVKGGLVSLVPFMAASVSTRASLTGYTADSQQAQSIGTGSALIMDLSMCDMRTSSVMTKAIVQNKQRGRRISA